MDFFRRIFNNTGSQTADKAVVDDPSNGKQPSEETNDPNDVSDLSAITAPSNISQGKTEPLTARDDENLVEDDKPTSPLPSNQEGVTRPLPSEPTMPAPRGHLVYGQASDKGMVRHNNQDTAMSFFYKSDSVDEFPDFGIFIIADGMGGHHDGEKASAITGRTVLSEITNSIYLPLIHGDDMNSVDRPTIADALKDAVKRANRAVRKEVPEGGTTITTLVVMSNFGHLAHVGDSRAYLITPQNGIEQITRDHSLVARLIELEQLTPEEAAEHEQRNVLYRAVGQAEELEVDYLPRRLPSNAHLLICSDGLWGMVTEDDILEVVRNTPDPQEACEKLTALANTKGGTDNISVILLKMPAN